MLLLLQLLCNFSKMLMSVDQALVISMLCALTPSVHLPALVMMDSLEMDFFVKVVVAKIKAPNVIVLEHSDK